MRDQGRYDRTQESACEQPLGPVQVGLIGALDAFSAGAVERELADLITGHAEVMLDLSDLELVTSGGLAMLERCWEVATESRHSLQLRVRDGSLVRRVLDAAALPALVAAVEGRVECRVEGHRCDGAEPAPAAG